MKHLDLFSGIGGFSLAVDTVWHEEKNEHIFVEWDDFCTEVLKKHWPHATYHTDIKRFVADTKLDQHRAEQGQIRETQEVQGVGGSPLDSWWSGGTDILTGGFPCQPFSQAGRRKGTDDDRYLWPSMLECIALFRPTWVIAENVGGLVTWNDGLVFETVCSDLEAQGYEVQPFVIPAVAVGAPHRRDRIWFVAHSTSARGGTEHRDISSENGRPSELASELGSTDSDAKDTISKRSGGRMESDGQVLARKSAEVKDARPSWEKDWVEVATELCRVDDGVHKRLDRNPRLKALGNAIVPQVAIEIMKAIRSSLTTQ